MKTKMISLALAASVCGSLAQAEPVRLGNIEIDAPWARASLGTSRPGAAYFTIRNTGTEADTLTAIETPVAAMPQLHTTEMADGMATMSEAGPTPIAPGAEITLQPGGMHAMLMGLNRPLEEGDSFPLTLVFDQAGAVTIEIPVMEMRASGPPD